MAIVQEFQADQTAAAATSITIAGYTISSNSNRVLLVWLSWQTTLTSTILDTVTFGGVALTQVAVKTNGALTIALYVLVNPASGATHDIVASFAGSDNGNIAMGAADFSGVAQTGTFGAAATSSATSNSPSQTVAGTTAGNEVVFAGGSNNTNANVSITAGTTGVYNRVVGSGSFRTRGWGDAKSAGGSVTDSWTLSASKPWATIGVEMKAAPTTTTYTQALAASATGSAALTRLAVRFRSLAASCSGTPAVARRAGWFRTLAGSVTASAALARGALHRRSLAAQATGSGALARIALRLRALAAAATGAGSLARVARHVRALAALATGQGLLARGAAKVRTLAATATASARLARFADRRRTLAAVVTGAAALGRRAHYWRLLGAVASVVANVIRGALSLAQRPRGWRGPNTRPPRGRSNSGE